MRTVATVLAVSLALVGAWGTAAPADALDTADPTPSDPQQTFNRSYGGPGIQLARDVAVLDDGYLIAGFGARPDDQETDVWLLRVDAQGDVRWNRTYGGSLDQEANAVLPVEDGYLVAGRTYDSSRVRPESDAWLAKVAPDGSERWIETYGSDGEDVATAILPAVDGSGYLLAGTSNSYGSAGYEAWAVRIGPDGQERWNRTSGVEGPSVAIDAARTDDGYVLVGRTSEADASIAMMDATGSIRSTAAYGGESRDSFWSVATDDDGLLLAGQTVSFGAGESDAWFLRTDWEGEVQLNVTVGGDETEWARDVAPAPEGYLIVGWTANGSNQDAMLVEVARDGEVQWSDPYGGPGSDGAWSVRATDGGHVIAGWTQPPGYTNAESWLLVYDSGTGTPSGRNGNPTSTAPMDHMTTPTSTTSPGFGAVVALLALLALGGRLVRR